MCTITSVFQTISYCIKRRGFSRFTHTSARMKCNIKTHLNRSLASAKELYVTTNSKCRIRFILKIIMKSVPCNGSGWACCFAILHRSVKLVAH